MSRARARSRNRNRVTSSYKERRQYQSGNRRKKKSRSERGKVAGTPIPSGRLKGTAVGKVDTENLEAFIDETTDPEARSLAIEELSYRKTESKRQKQSPQDPQDNQQSRLVGATNLTPLQHRERSDNLRTLGFDNYTEYCRSELWLQIRNRVLERDEYQCRCGRVASQVHHRQYDLATLRGETLRHLVSMCPGCHKRRHRAKRDAL